MSVYTLNLSFKKLWPLASCLVSSRFRYSLHPIPLDFFVMIDGTDGSTMSPVPIILEVLKYPYGAYRGIAG
jgi:hypothetical protein